MPTIRDLIPRKKAEIVTDPMEVDRTLLEMWIDGRPKHTIRGYGQEVKLFYATVGKPLRACQMEDLQPFMATLASLPKESSRARRLAALKSLFSYAYRTGYTSFNLGVAFRLPKVPNNLAERILTEEEVLHMFAAEHDPMRHALLRLLYHSAMRREELAHLTWAQLRPRGDRGQVIVHGKGNKTRTVLLPVATWKEVQALRPISAPDEWPVFSLRPGEPLSESSIARIVRDAAKQAGISRPVSPHFLRHSHATHAIEHGAPLALVQATLGHTSLAMTGRYVHANPEASSGEFLKV